MIQSGFFNSVNGDRRYNADFFARFFGTLIGNGVFPNPSTGLQVYESSNMTVTVKPGKGWINGYFIISDSDYNLTLDTADGVLNRIDRIVMRLDFATREIQIIVKKGTFASSPVVPTLQRDADAYELALADIYVGKGVTTITRSNITDQRLNSTVCGVVRGLITEVDTTTIFNQYQAWFNQKTGETDTIIQNWLVANEQEFNTWFNGIKDILDGDVAANLASRITSLEQELDAHKTDYAQHIEDLVSHGVYGIATGTNALAMTISNVTAYVEGMLIAFKNTTANTGTVTLNINSLGAKAIKKANGNALTSGNLKAGGIYQLRYDGSSFILLGEGGEYGTATASDVLAGKTFGTEGGIKEGNLTIESLGGAKYSTGTVNSTTIITLDFIPSIIFIYVKGDSNSATPIQMYDGSFSSAFYTRPIHNYYDGSGGSHIANLKNVNNQNFTIEVFSGTITWGALRGVN